MESRSIACGPGKRTLLSGRTDSTGNGDGCTVLLDSVGMQLLRRTWGSDAYENPVQIIALPDSGWAILAETASLQFPGRQDLLLCRFNASGDSLWSRRFGGPANDLGRQLMSLPDGDLPFWVPMKTLELVEPILSVPMPTELSRLPIGSQAILPSPAQAIPSNWPFNHHRRRGTHRVVERRYYRICTDRGVGYFPGYRLRVR